MLKSNEWATIKTIKQKLEKVKENEMILENACEYKDYLGIIFDELGFNGSFEVIDNNIHLNIIPNKGEETPIIALNGFICIFDNISIISYIFVCYWWLFAEFNAR
ncbi:hypothetical protein DD759_02540 [Helicobacter pylori]|nr:hypothetical protein DD759_02540 [Helicobacter pylori]